MLLHKKILVSGIVQGVGFRPFCARLARMLNLSGSVINTSGGVEIELRGGEEDIKEYERRLRTDGPPASVITSVVELESAPLDSGFAEGFSILKSRREEKQLVLIPPDLAVCENCLREMRDPEDRRHRYPFINCTDCGPRYTIIRELPYDRPKTTMADFSMCPLCEGEYSDPSDRRFHAQPDACWNCGPALWLTDRTGREIARGDEAVGRCSALLDEGKICAVKGIGGFHIACSPFEDAVLSELRRRKGRKDKPFAVMAASLEEAEKIVRISAVGKRLLLSPQRPIVLCCPRKNYPLSPLVAPGVRSLGVMLPYSPLHHLLLEGKAALVMTSANFSDAPIVSDNHEALSSLGEIVDFFLFSNRDIHMPIDDSVASPMGSTYFLLRRARGYTPIPMTMRKKAPVILGAGSEMKASFCLSQDSLVFPGQYLGDMKQRGTAAYYQRGLNHFLFLYALKPEHLVHDLHPQFISTAIAEKTLGSPGLKKLAVQHHHAHFAACLLENDREGPAIGLILDGTGYGTDGTIWGGEILVGDASEYERKGHFLPFRLPGGDKAVMEPWRTALSLLAKTYGDEEAARRASRLWKDRRGRMEQVLPLLPWSPVTTSCGRFFDGASALLGLAETISYDGQAAMTLEGIAEGSLAAPFEIVQEDGRYILDWRPGVKWLMDSKESLSPALIAGGIHGGLARALVEICLRLRKETGLNEAVLSGGVWQNRRLLAFTLKGLRAEGFLPLVHRLLPPNDECVSVGQVAAGAARWGTPLG
ncbi:carbamoyltransferase HypF [Aminivibrio sp.]